MKVRFFKGGFIAGLLVLGVSMGAQARSVSVVSVSDDVVTLNFGAGDGKAYKLAVARGAYDAGDVRADWDAIEIIGDVAADQSSATWTVPKGEYRYARFFLLDTDLPFTKSCAFVRSNYKCWIDTGVQARSGVRAELDMTAKAISDCTILGAREGSTRFFLMHLNSTSFNSMSQ